jgi:DNA-binding MarR family transcriptional regulator/GNAT superfamily N-acetyltransferase
MTTAVDDVRGFNRFYTRVLGLLRPHLAGSSFGLSEARVLFELANGDDVAVSDLRRELDLDAGYLSRILSGFITAGLLAREQSATDGRRQVVRLTTEGREAFAELDRLQADAIDALLAPLDEAQRSELIGAMGRIRRALGDMPAWRGLVLRSPVPGDLGWVVERHGARYAAEYGWDATFEALVARIVAEFGERRDTQREAAWIAELDGERVGCVFCTAADAEHTAQLRLLLVESSARGSGVGTRLVDECVRFAKRAGYRRMTLWTNDDLVGEYWSRDL